MIVVAGEALVDLLVRPDGSRSAAYGGGPFNTARTIARLGGDVAFLGRLSSDRFGRGARAVLADDGVDLRWVETTDQPSTTAIAELDARGVATYRFQVAGTAAPGLTEAAVAAAVGSRPVALHVGTLGLVLEPMATGLAAAAAGLDPAVLLMVDPNCRPPAIADRSAYLGHLGAVLDRADIVKVSREDLGWLEPGASVVDAARRLRDRGRSLVLVTDGGAAVRAVAPGFEAEIPVPRVTVADTVGAGDAFGGAFLARWVELGLGRDGLADAGAVIAAAGLAARVAASTCTRIGADPPWRADTDWPPIGVGRSAAGPADGS